MQKLTPEQLKSLKNLRYRLYVAVADTDSACRAISTLCDHDEDSEESKTCYICQFYRELDQARDLLEKVEKDVDDQLTR